MKLLLTTFLSWIGWKNGEKQSPKRPDRERPVSESPDSGQPDSERPNTTGTAPSAGADENKEHWIVDFEKDIRLTRVYPSEIEALKTYVAALYEHDDDFDSMVNIAEGVTSLLRNENLATPYFITRGVERIGYVILTKYHSVEKGGLTMYIDELYVQDQLRRQGVGKQILSRILEIARAAGAKHLWAQAEPYNDAACKFFENQGFHRNPYLNFEMPL